MYCRENRFSGSANTSIRNKAVLALSVFKKLNELVVCRRYNPSTNRRPSNNAYFDVNRVYFNSVNNSWICYDLTLFLISRHRFVNKTLLHRCIWTKISVSSKRVNKDFTRENKKVPVIAKERNIWIKFNVLLKTETLHNYTNDKIWQTICYKKNYIHAGEDCCTWLTMVH